MLSKMNSFLKVIFCIIFHQSNTEILSPLTSYSLESVENSLLDIFDDHFKNGMVLICYQKKYESGIGEKIAKILSSRNPVQISNNNYDKPEWFYLMFRMKVAKADNIVILINEEEKVQEIFLKVREQAVWDAQAKILILLESAENCQEKSKEILITSWNLAKCVNVAVLCYDKMIKTYTSFPYDKDGFRLAEDWFPTKIFNDFGGHDFTIATTPKEPYVLPPKNPLEYRDGVEVRILQAIAKLKNFNLKYKETPKGENPYMIYNKDHQRVGLLGLLYRHEADIACFGVGIGNDRYYVAEALEPHTQDTLVWMVPAPGPKSNWDSVYIGFSPEIWLSIFSFLIAIAFTFRLVASNSTDYEVFSNFSKCLLDSWSATLNLGLTSNPKSQMMKMFLAAVLIYSLVITAAYQSFLITLLTSTRLSKGWQTIEEAIDAGAVAYMFPSGMYMYNQTQHDMWNKILSKDGHIFETNYTKMLLRITKKKDAVSMMIRFAAEYIVRKKYMTSTGPLAMHLSPYFTTYPVTCYMAPGHPLKNVFNQLIARLVESGITGLWLEQILDKAETAEVATEDETKVLTVKNLEVTLIILGIGLVLSLTVFIAEILVFKCRVRITKNGQQVRETGTENNAAAIKEIVDEK